MVLVAVGVKPNTQLGVEAGLKTGAKGALAGQSANGDRDSDIYAAGDCVETWHRLLHRYTYLPWALQRTSKGDVLERTQSEATASLPGRWERRW